MFREALRYPTSGDRGVEAVLVTGGLLMLAAFFAFFGALFLFVPGVVTLGCLVVVRGYHVRVMRWTTRYPDRGAPSLTDWSQLLVDGVKAILVGVVYFLPVMLLAGVAVVTAGISSVPQPSAAVGIVRSVTGLLVLFVFLYLLAMFYLLPAAVASFAYHDDIGAAFRIRELASGVLTEDYAVGWVVSLLYQTVVFPVMLFSYVFLVGFFIQAHVGIGVRHIYGRATRDAFDFEPMEFEDEQAADERSEPPEGEVPDLTDMVSTEDTRRRERLSEDAPRGGGDPWTDEDADPSAEDDANDSDHDPMAGESGRN